ncbi:MAG: hypothetical protein ACPIOQ_57955 [Promethearchaeia archaeon]
MTTHRFFSIRVLAVVMLTIVQIQLVTAFYLYRGGTTLACLRCASAIARGRTSPLAKKTSKTSPLSPGTDPENKSGRNTTKKPTLKDKRTPTSRNRDTKLCSAKPGWDILHFRSRNKIKRRIDHTVHV